MKLRQLSSDSADSCTATLFFSVQIAFARLNRIFLLLFAQCFLCFLSECFLSSVASFRKRKFQETALNQNTNRSFSKCFSECCQPGKLSD